jgi:hypothetical protein
MYIAAGLVLLELSGRLLNNDEVDPDKFKKILHKKAAQEGEAFLKVKIKGCKFHYYQSRQRCLANGKFMQSDQRAEFRELTTLLQTTEDRAEFDRTVPRIRQIAPGARDWLEWWINPIHAALIFPVFMPMPANIQKETPDTNNNAETINRVDQLTQRSNAALVVQLEEEFNVRQCGSVTCISLLHNLHHACLLHTHAYCASTHTYVVLQSTGDQLQQN